MISQNIAQLFDLSGKAALVTGAAMGLGQAIAFRLAEAGASVMITDIDMEAARSTKDHIKANGGNAEAIYADVGSANDANKSIQSTIEAFNSLDILVNNAGIFAFSPSLQMSEETWDRTININLKGMFFHSQAAAHEMIKSGSGGKIINMASMDGLHPTRMELSHYNASKGGVIMLTKALALEFAQYGILVNAIAPGPIMTPGAAAMADSLQARGVDLNVQTEIFFTRLPLNRLGEPDDIAKVALFLASEAANYMTGSLVLVDGGYLLS
jgi:2-deoxy-D-gluconate 3-dehydrogenase